MNPWLEPFRRSYQSIKERLIGKVKEIRDENDMPLITDTSDGNIITLLISLFSSIAEVIHVYIDNVYRESFLNTATQLSSVYNHLNLIDYRGHMATPSVVDVIFTRYEDSGDLNIAYTADKGDLTIVDNKGNIWELDEKLVIPASVTQAKARFVQHNTVNLGSSVLAQDEAGRLYAYIPETPGQLIEDSSLTSIYIGTGESQEEYLVKDTLAYSTPTDKHCVIVSINSTAIYVLFGDNKFGKRPANSQIGKQVTFGNCRETAGSQGNIQPNTLTRLNESFGNFTINNLTASSGGTDYEDIYSLQFRAPLSVKTLGVAITKNDILNIVRQNPQVARAEIEYVCGQYIRIYISGLGNVAANTGLCSAVKTELVKHLPINTEVEVLPLQARVLCLNCKVTGRPSFTEDIIRNQIMNALYLAYNISSVSTANSQIKGIRISDMYALIDNLTSVDYLTIREMYITPWLEAINNNQLVYITDFKLNKATKDKYYILTFTSGSNFIVYPYENSSTLDNSGNIKVTQFNGKVGEKCTIEDEDFSFEFLIPTTGVTGNTYKFQVIEGNRDIDLQGFFNISIDPTQVTLEIEEVL